MIGRLLRLPAFRRRRRRLVPEEPSEGRVDLLRRALQWYLPEASASLSSPQQESLRVQVAGCQPWVFAPEPGVVQLSMPRPPHRRRRHGLRRLLRVA